MRENGFYWVRYVVPYVAEWDGADWYLPGHISPYEDKHFSYIADHPIKASIE